MFSYVSFSFYNKTGREGKNGSISRFLESSITFDPCWPRQALICISWISNRIGHKNKHIQLTNLILTQELIELLVFLSCPTTLICDLCIPAKWQKGVNFGFMPTLNYFPNCLWSFWKTALVSNLSGKICFVFFSLWCSHNNWLKSKVGVNFTLFGVLHNVVTPVDLENELICIGQIWNKRGRQPNVLSYGWRY